MLRNRENWSIPARPGVNPWVVSNPPDHQVPCLQLAQRIQKLLAHLGIASRRQVECWIREGEIIVNGECCTLGQQVRGDESVLVCGTPVDLQARVPVRVLRYHKPVGEVVSRREQGAHATVFEQLPDPGAGRWVSVGRLDLNTSGLLLLTTDGTLADALMHPRSGLEREYRVRVHGRITREIVSRLQQGVQLDDGMVQLVALEVFDTPGTNTWCRIVLTEGRNRVVRRLWASQGLEVSRLIRMRYGPLALPEALRPGEWDELSPQQVGRLYRAARCSPGA